MEYLRARFPAGPCLVIRIIRQGDFASTLCDASGALTQHSKAIYLKIAAAEHLFLREGLVRS